MRILALLLIIPVLACTQVHVQSQTAPREDADLTVAFRVQGESRVRLRTAGRPNSEFLVAREYIEGSLVVEAADARSGELLWEGAGQTDVFQGADIEVAAQDTVEAVLAEFPPPGSPGATPPR